MLSSSQKEVVLLNERLKKLRKALDLTQQEFADRIGVKRNTIATYEIGRNNPLDAVVASICREFNVSEAWLRTGDGEMFVKLPRNEALAAQIQAFLQGGTDSFRERLISLLLRLKPEQWDALEGYLVELMAAPSSDAGKNIPAPTTSETNASPDLAAELAELRKQNQELATKVAAMEEDYRDEQLAADFGSALSALQSGLPGNSKKTKK